MTLTVYITRDYEHMSDVAADIFLKDLRTLTIFRAKDLGESVFSCLLSTEFCLLSAVLFVSAANPMHKTAMNES